MAAHKEPKGILVLTCAKCGDQVSGPDKQSVTETMARHYAQTGHGK